MTRNGTGLVRCLVSAAVAIVDGCVGTALRTDVAAAQTPPRDDAPPALQSSGLPLPRFVSLKSDQVNLRNGPGTDYPAAWVFRRAGLPLEVTKEFEGWRQVRDSEGTTGWIAQSFLSGRRTAMVLPWERKPDRPVPRVPLWASSRSGAPVVVEVEAGVIANIMACDGDWCEVTIEDYRGFVEQKKLWGVYQGEKIR